MRQLSYFFMTGLAFMVLQVSTVEAQMGDPNQHMDQGNPNQGMGDPKKS
jgi:hypothetical protein